MSCPLYGARLMTIKGEPVFLLNRGSNQCALVMDAHSPCRMDIEGQKPDWDKCPRNPANYERLTVPAGARPC